MATEHPRLKLGKGASFVKAFVQPCLVFRCRQTWFRTGERPTQGSSWGPFYDQVPRRQDAGKTSIWSAWTISFVLSSCTRAITRSDLRSIGRSR
jgi:hypothetical protein